MSGSGHIAGVVNPPDKLKYQYWTGGKPTGKFADWVESAVETPGSWWPHWHKWIESLDNRTTAARKPGGNALNAIADAPGPYVLERV
jgi:polyhydroxyalkanoate synthase